MSSTTTMMLVMLRLESRRSIALLLSPLLLAAAWWMAWNGIYGSMYEASFTNVYIWEETSRVIKDSILTTGPILAGLSAWVAGREARRGTEDLLSTTAIPPASRIFATWAGTVSPFVAVYVLLALLLGVPTAINATWGAPLPGYILVGFVALLMDAAIGFAAGHYLRNRFAAPLISIALYVLHLMPIGFYDFGINYTLLSPAAYSNFGGADVFHEPPQLVAPQLLFFGGLSATVLFTVLFRGVSGKAYIVRLAPWPICVIGLVMALGTEHPDSIRVGETEAVAFEPVCKEGKIKVCVHPAYEKLLPATAETINEVAEPLVEIPGAPTLALQANGSGTVPEGTDMDKVALFSSAGDAAHYDVVEGLLVNEEEMRWSPYSEEPKTTKEDLKRCGDIPDKRYFSPGYEAQNVVQRWLLRRNGGSRGEIMYMGECPKAGELADRFAALPIAEREAWLENNLADLRAGKVTLKDLP